MKLQKVEKLERKKIISSIKIYTHPFTSVIRFEWQNFRFGVALSLTNPLTLNRTDSKILTASVINGYNSYFSKPFERQYAIGKFMCLKIQRTMTLCVLQLGVPSSWIVMETAATLRWYHLGYKIKKTIWDRDAISLEIIITLLILNSPIEC